MDTIGGRHQRRGRRPGIDRAWRLSVHGLATGAAVSADEIYELGCYGDEVM